MLGLPQGSVLGVEINWIKHTFNVQACYSDRSAYCVKMNSEQTSYSVWSVHVERTRRWERC